MQILILEPDGFPTEAIDRLRGLGTVAIGPNAPGAGAAEVVFVRLSTTLDANFHARYPALRWIVSPTTGLNHIDLAHFAAREVGVISLRGRVDFLDHIHATAEHTLALALALIRRLAPAACDVAAGNWNRYPFKGRELFGKTVLLYGYGRIGRMVAPLYRAFGCHVLGCDIIPDRVPDDMRCDFPGILSAIDVLSIHLPLNDTTMGIVNTTLLARLSRHAIVVNTARGEIIDQPALLAALERENLAGAALDVLWGEPTPIDTALQARLAALQGRLLVTPHIGGFTYESLEMVENYIVDVFIEAASAR
ncbi:hypothetical protein KCP91_18925 [Microvirga sp. SRT01]|uniref:Hydroxyacid dehydrogenase n=1 Tax=Sphingomonas longa TaxID=2778730 RepID=A0ABS2DC10_9SPHN|nr:D-isomer specific 2-hydroxyacid dehydrogenase family protein [Microvirga sp. SRT01]MBM6578462.1 hypothetical protein [Sphingomonas sp. BT552]MBR7711502.1 hypothetical protein [Microvirga sp. SRT01]